MIRTGVLIPTPVGPSRICRIREDRTSDGSYMGLLGLKESNISPGYASFCAPGIGIVAEHFGPRNWGAWIDPDIDRGESWKLPVFLSHILHELGVLAALERMDPSVDRLVIATGEMEKFSLDVLKVNAMARKVLSTAEYLRDIGIEARPVPFFVPAANEQEARSAYQDLLPELQVTLEIVAVSTVQEVVDWIGVAWQPATDSDPQAEAVVQNGVVALPGEADRVGKGVSPKGTASPGAATTDPAPSSTSPGDQAPGPEARNSRRPIVLALVIVGLLAAAGLAAWFVYEPEPVTGAGGEDTGSVQQTGGPVLTDENGPGTPVPSAAARLEMRYLTGPRTNRGCENLETAPAGTPVRLSLAADLRLPPPPLETCGFELASSPTGGGGLTVLVAEGEMGNPLHLPLARFRTGREAIELAVVSLTADAAARYRGATGREALARELSGAGKGATEGMNVERMRLFIPPLQAR